MSKEINKDFFEEYLDNARQQYFDDIEHLEWLLEQKKEIIKIQKQRIDNAIEYVEDNCIEQICDMPKGCYREIASIGDLENLLSILKGDNNDL